MRINNPLYEVMWTTGWRDTIWSDLDQNWDIIVIGGGITGAGILREAVRLGLRVLLLENTTLRPAHRAARQSWFTVVCATCAMPRCV